MSQLFGGAQGLIKCISADVIGFDQGMAAIVLAITKQDAFSIFSRKLIL